MPSPERARFPYEGALIFVVALVCLAFQVRLPTELPAEDDYAQVQKVLEAEAQPGDVLLLYPWWAERARLFAPDRLPVVGYQGSDADTLEVHPRIWVLAQPDLPRSSWSTFWSAFGAGRTIIGTERSFGHLKLSLYSNGRYKPVVFSSVEALPSAQVYLERPDGSRTPCPFDGRAHRCPGGSYVAAEWHEVHFQPRRCLHLYPPGGDTKLVAEFANVPALNESSLYAGLTWDREYFHDERATTTDVVLETNGVGVAHIELVPAHTGLQRATAPGAPAGSTLRVWSRSANAENRDTCVEVFGYGAGAP